MAKETFDYREGCPFWSTRTTQCQLGHEGLFIPLNDHIEAYCTTLHYPQCRQFSRHAAGRRQPPENSGGNRRKFPRLAVSQRVTLVRLLPAGSVAKLAAGQDLALCWTLDLGKGGMRLATDLPLAKAEVIRFTFTESFPPSVQSGQGQIAWCTRPYGQPVYQAGIAFQDDRLIDTMGLYLGLITAMPPAAE